MVLDEEDEAFRLGERPGEDAVREHGADLFCGLHFARGFAWLRWMALGDRCNAATRRSLSFSFGLIAVTVLFVEENARFVDAGPARGFVITFALAGDASALVCRFFGGGSARTLSRALD